MAAPADIVKIGAVIFDDRQRLLIVKPRANPFWLFVGGKIEAGENAEACLAREIHEELSVAVSGTPRFYLESPIEPAAGDPAGRTVQIRVYFVDIAGEPKPSSEIERIHWLSANDARAGRLPMGSILSNHVVPQLIEEGLLA